MLPPDYELLQPGQDARVLVVSLRRIRDQLSRCLEYEFEDAIGDFDRADVVGPVRSVERGTWAARKRQLLDRLASRRPRSPLEARAGGHQLLFVVVESVEDLLQLGELRALLERARVSVLYVTEAWAKDLERHGGALERVSWFDHVAVGCRNTVAEMQRLTRRPCFYLPPAVDTLLFHPGSPPPRRSIDLYGMGRRSATTHAAFSRLADERGWLYLFDSTTGGRAPEPREHRALLARLLARTVFLTAYRAKVDQGHQTGGQEEVGARFFEGAAAGALLIGERPRDSAFEQLFDWPDALIDLPWGASEVAPVLDALLADPERIARARRENLRGSLLRHDWVHRWRLVLERAGLPPTRRMNIRAEVLAERAASP